MKRQVGIGAAVLGAVTLVVIAATGSPVSINQEVSAARTPTAASLSFSQTRIAREVGVEHQYKVQLAQTVTLDAENRIPFVISVDGTWAVAYAGETEHGELFRAQLRDAKPSVKRNNVDASAALGDSVGEPFFFTTTSEGRLISLAFAPDLDESARGVLSALAATFQVSSRAGASWDTVESDSIGDYQARYARKGAGLHRERVAYQRVTGDGALSAAIVTSGTEIRLRGDGWPSDVDGHEVTRVGTQQLGVIVDTKFSLRHAGTARVTPGSPDGMVTMAIDAASTAARSSTHEEDSTMVDGASLADLLAGLASVNDEHARGYQYLRIAALMRLEPDTVRAAQRLVEGGAPAASVLIGAMGEAGTPVAQAALGELLASPALVKDARMHAAITLGLTAAPTRDTLRALEESAQGAGDLANTATLAQGNAAMRMRDDDSSASNQQVDALLARLARATDDDERALVLRALGNTGDPRILDAVSRSLASANIGVRMAATEALRLVRGAAADQLVLARFADSASLVRSAAVFAITERDLAPFAAALSRVVKRDPDIGVRRAIVDLAAARLDELRSLVEHVAANDPDAELRAIAVSVLAPT
ncbi:MAG: HEAT repeat domain-containing protein [Myxococcota bacterium]|nr:HEAT repeat domain-containing protein [Myxococcota bacterium]